ncbi:hypothetical protein [Paractinoplanes durhamensis]|uniref:Anti-sigma factor n=1 Tax=Paractinoplanes durhamensis TaxID=113563 RepID=A0ABQ3Z687_9ACTN|nr:hypothetical protein [Actinoplanes durhamensis]GIE05340.1 hypothetical protein Adu01nite_66900 [Actinoplanes durhamensis]
MTGAEFREVDIDLLADYIGGALSGTPDESVVATLIADDPAWQAAYESLSGGMAAVSAELGRFEPEPMPADVIARLDAALASSIAAPTPISAEPAAPPAPHLTLVRDDPGHGVPQEKQTERKRGSKAGPSRRLRWATPIAIAAGVIAFVGFGLDYLAGRESSNDSATSSAAGEARTQKDAAAMPAGPQLLSSGTDYSADNLVVAPPGSYSASGALESQNSPLAAPGLDSGGSSVAERDVLSRLREPTALQECLDAIAAENSGGAIYAQSVDFARFNGSPAVVVRFSAENGSWAWASGSKCGTGGDADTLGKSPVR